MKESVERTREPACHFQKTNQDVNFKGLQHSPPGAHADTHGNAAHPDLVPLHP